MFLSEYRHSLDSKDRLTIPARYRELLGEEAYLVRGFDHNLMVLTDKTFEVIANRLQAMSITDPLARSLRRLILGSATRVDIDKAGRILLPDILREKADLGSEVVLVGQGNYFELWSPEEWAKQEQALDDDEANTQRFKVLDLSTGS